MINDYIWKISLAIIIFSLIIVIPFYITVENYEKNHLPVNDDLLVLKNDFNKKITSEAVQKAETIDYDIYVYGDNLSGITIFLVTFEVYRQNTHANFSSLFDYWSFLYFGVNYTNCIMVKGDSYSRHVVDYNIRLSDIDKYVFLFFNFGEENVNINIEFKINNFYIQNRQKFIEMMTASFGLTAPIIALILALNQLYELREKTNKISIENKKISVEIEEKNNP